MDASPPNTPAKPDPKAAKEAKLAQALRDNLRRRKAGARDDASVKKE